MPEKPTRKSARAKRDRTLSAVSAVLAAGHLVELVYDRRENRTSFAEWQDGKWKFTDYVEDAGRELVPYSPDNNLMQHNVVLFPTRPKSYGSQDELVEEVRSFIHRYVDLSDGFELLTSYYVLLTWLYDGFNEVPYLRVTGDYGTGKTRFLQTVGAICYRPIFANGASTVSPIFHMLDLFGGTLVIDEADFRFSDEKAEMVKIFNNGNVRGMPVLRSQITRDREFDPRVFQVFGPKIVATRGEYDDAGLASRFLTERTGGRALRNDIPINLPSGYEEEALALRNKLLLFRFRYWGAYRPNNNLADPSLEPRVNQILAPLLSIVEDKRVQKKLREIARDHCVTKSKAEKRLSQ
jgi:hypothetical protein